MLIHKNYRFYALVNKKFYFIKILEKKLMQLQFSFKNTKITQKDELLAEEKLLKVEQFADIRIMKISVEFFQNLPEKVSYKISILTELTNGEVFKNEESGRTFLEALDKVQEEVIRSAQKIKEKILTEKRKSRSKAKLEIKQDK
ncbi:MAG: hypothetical protein Fur0024_5000 [Patescibacteria group bacterium]